MKKMDEFTKSRAVLVQLLNDDALPKVRGIGELGMSDRMRLLITSCAEVMACMLLNSTGNDADEAIAGLSLLVEDMKNRIRDLSRVSMN